MTCVVCGQLRPDLDMTLDDDDEDLASAMGAGAAGSSLRPTTPETAQDDAPPALPSHVVMSEVSSPAPNAFRIDRPYVAMQEMPSVSSVRMPTDSLADRLGPVLLIVMPLAGGMAGALNMLQSVSDFSTGSWYAVGTVFVLILIATLFSGLIASGFLYLIRIRWTMFLRLVFCAAAAGVAYYGVLQLPRHIQVRANDLPGLVFSTSSR